MRTLLKVSCVLAGLLVGCENAPVQPPESVTSPVVEHASPRLQPRVATTGWSEYLETATRAQQAADKSLLGSGGEAASVEAADKEWIIYLNAKYSDWNK
jgi:hypothetical protein